MLPAVRKALGGSQETFRAVATHFWCACLSIARIFHVPDVHDLGFSLLTGGAFSPSRDAIWRWMGQLSEKAVRQFQRLTEPLANLAKASRLLSLDSHVVPCWTRKYAIPKTYHTCRNKYMKGEHLYYFYDLDGHCLLRLTARAGGQELPMLMLCEIRRLRRDTGAVRLRVILDAGACKDEDALLELMREPGVEVLVRAVRKPTYLAQWQTLPPSSWERHEESNETKDRPPCVLEVANTTTRLGTAQTPIRTIVAREYRGRKRKECYHVLYTNIAHAPSLHLIHQYRQRQNHEQAYRVGVHDLNLDAITHGYVKDSDPEQPDFDPARLALVGWLKALAFNALAAFRVHLPEPFCHMQAGSLIRHFLLRPGCLYATGDDLIVAIEPFGNHEELTRYIDKLNAQRQRIPWLGNRRLRITAAEQTGEISGKRIETLLGIKDVWC